MSSHLLIRTLDRGTMVFVIVIAGIALVVPLLNLAVPVASSLHVPTYLVSLFSVDQRAGSAGRSQAYWDTFSAGVFSGGTSGSFSENTPIMTMFTFTADANFQDIFIEETDNIGNADTNLSAFTLYAVPEPSSTALAAGAAMLALLRRRRA